MILCYSISKGIERQIGAWQRGWTDMKKKVPILSVVLILLVGIAVWYHAPIDLMNLDANEVLEIVIFNGNSGYNFLYKNAI